MRVPEVRSLWTYEPTDNLPLDWEGHHLPAAQLGLLCLYFALQLLRQSRLSCHVGNLLAIECENSKQMLLFLFVEHREPELGAKALPLKHGTRASKTSVETALATTALLQTNYMQSQRKRLSTQ